MKHKNIIIVALAVLISGTILTLAIKKNKAKNAENSDGDAEYNDLFLQIDKAPK